MASIADARHPAGRWSLTALLRRLQPRPQALDAPPQTETADVDGTADAAMAIPELRKRRHYPPRRETFIESAAMGREMYRL